jgi:hypothetical protein
MPRIHRITGGRKGWRLPTAELTSLPDASALPPRQPVLIAPWLPVTTAVSRLVAALRMKRSGPMP